jgi:hypothetical protein
MSFLDADAFMDKSRCPAQSHASGTTTGLHQAAAAQVAWDSIVAGNAPKVPGGGGQGIRRCGSFAAAIQLSRDMPAGQTGAK